MTITKIQQKVSRYGVRSGSRFPSVRGQIRFSVSQGLRSAYPSTQNRFPRIFDQCPRVTFTASSPQSQLAVPYGAKYIPLRLIEHVLDPSPCRP